MQVFSEQLQFVGPAAEPVHEEDCPVAAHQRELVA
jgi:hypothetical protein